MSLLYTVINAGTPGNNSLDLLARARSDLSRSLPDLAVVAIGTNDALNSQKAISLDQFEDNIRGLVNFVLETVASLILIVPPPCVDEYVRERHPRGFFGDETPSIRLNRYCEVLRCFKSDGPIRVVDIHAHFSSRKKAGYRREDWILNEENSGIRDGVHPTPSGYYEIAREVFSAVRRSRFFSGTVACLGDSITFGTGAQAAATPPSSCYPAVLESLLNNSLTTS